ncbi:MAG TPA: DUF1796 family putative cysteine peptidase [Lachnospiraceae bacterium]|nr:DUF1796 family putative cysteine peptidase [Lachnospiraceae bacterium]
MFDNFVSLGCFCGTASSMVKYGLRGFSGPFDWMISDFDGVVENMDKDFCDFLQKDNLQIVSEESGIIDTKYGFYFKHDKISNFNEDFERVYDKYIRRIERFRIILKSKTCFIRVVIDQNEVSYISNNIDHINQVIKRGNSNNEIIFMIPEILSAPKNLTSYYIIDMDSYLDIINSQEELGSLFDKNKEFITYCKNNYSEQLQKENIIFNLPNSNKKLDTYTIST